jgi:DNA-binding CsgD family transcriptional regulator
MNVFNDMLLELYRLAQNAPVGEFQTLALDKMREALDFDSAYWATGVVKPGKGFVAHSFTLYRQPQEWLADYERINHNDAMTYEVFQKQGTTVNAALCSPHWQERFDPESREHLRRYNVSHCLGTIIAEPVLQIWTGVALYRADAEHPFSEDTRLLVQNLVPHLSEAWNINRFAYMESARNNGIPSNQGRAICDTMGVLYNADRNFTGLMLAEWPEWQGPQLPREVQETISRKEARRYIGCRTTITIETLQNMELLTVRERTAIDELSAREHDVATLFAKGENFRAIADELHIAPVTVRNHLRHIYTKLGISNKIELVRRIRGD